MSHKQSTEATFAQDPGGLVISDLVMAKSSWPQLVAPCLLRSFQGRLLDSGSRAWSGIRWTGFSSCNSALQCSLPLRLLLAVGAPLLRCCWPPLGRQLPLLRRPAPCAPGQRDTRAALQRLPSRHSCPLTAARAQRSRAKAPSRCWAKSSGERERTTVRDRCGALFRRRRS